MKRRSGMTMVELLIVVAIMAVLISILIPAVQRARESANATRCCCNLKQIGLACHMYHDVFGKFPNEDGRRRETMFYSLILPFIEENNFDFNNPHGVASFLCPSRRGVEVGARCDYGFSMHQAPQAHPTLHSVDTKFKTVLGGKTHNTRDYDGVSLVDISIRFGTSYVFLLTHKGSDPKLYVPDRVPQQVWNSTINHWVFNSDINTVRSHDPGWMMPYYSRDWTGISSIPAQLSPITTQEQNDHRRLSLSWYHKDGPFKAGVTQIAPVKGWGSPHNSVPILCCDGSVRHPTYQDFANAQSKSPEPYYMEHHLEAAWYWNVREYADSNGMD